MSELFLSILNMSLKASYVIIFVMLIRLPLKKAPKFISYALWGVVAFRLIIPFSFESMFSLMPRNMNAVPIPRDIIYQQSPQINSGIEVVDSFVSQSLPTPTIGASANPLQIYVELGAYIWVIGIIALFVYSLVSILILKRQLKGAQLIENNIFEAKNLKTPFVLGLIKPKIYLPAGINDEERNYILLHEQTHIHRKDHIIKILSFFILSIHWFNPLVWIAFILMSIDMELSCDERVLKEINEDIKKPYANSLLSLATGRYILNGSPLAFGEGNVRGRIKNVLSYKKPRFWVIVFSIIIVIAIGIGFMANPKDTEKLSDFSDIYEVSEKWAEALKNRDGKIRYELMTPESKTDYYNSLVDINGEEYPWVIGGSSPYVVSYEIKTSDTSAIITYVTETSEPEEYIYQEQVFFNNQEGKTFVSKYGVIVSYLRKDLYEQAIEIQKAVNEGHQTWRLSPEDVALEFVHNDLGVEGGEIISSSNNDVVFKKDNGVEIKIKLYRPINNNNGFLAIYEYSIGTNHYILDNDYLAPMFAETKISFDVESNLDIIMSSPKTSSNPQDYINAHKNEYENFMKYGGEDALQYMLSQFEVGNAEGLRGQIMMRLCKELLGARNNVTDESLSSQEWYDALDIRQEIMLPNYKYDGQDPIEKLVYDTEIEKSSASNKRGGFIIVAPKVFGSYEEEDMLKVFVTTYSARYKIYGNVLSEEGGSIVPATITYRKDNKGGYVLKKYEQAGDGSEFWPSIRKYCIMPVSEKEIKGLADKIINHYGDYEDIRILLQDNLFKHLRKNGMGVKDATLTNSQGEIEFLINDPKYKP